MTVSAIALKPRGLKSSVREMKLPAALFTRPVSGPEAKISSTMRVDGLGVSDIDAESRDLAAMPLHEVCRRLLANALAAAADENLSAEAEEAVGHRFAEARTATGDKNALAFEQALFEHRFSRAPRPKPDTAFSPARITKQSSQKWHSRFWEKTL